MRDSFQLELKDPNEQKQSHQIRAMHMMSGLFILIYAAQYLRIAPIQWLTVIGLLIPALAICLLPIFRPDYFKQAESNRIFRILETALLVLGGLHFLQKTQTIIACLFFGIAVLTLFLLWLENRLLTKRFVNLNAKGIQIDLPLKTIHLPYTQLINVVVNPNYLTLIESEHRIRQFPLQTESMEIDWQELDAFLDTRFPERKA